MRQNEKRPLPAGLPKRFAGGATEFKRLCAFLGIENRQQQRALLEIEGVKAAVRSLKASVAGRTTAERQRRLLTAFYERPDKRRDVWRATLETASTLRVPSFEFIALRGYDEQFRERDVDEGPVRDVLQDLPDGLQALSDAPDWQRPALAALPALHRDIAKWHDLPHDRREEVLSAMFATATVLDDLRLLQRAARSVDALAEEFAILLEELKDDPEEPPSNEEELIRRWQETCEQIGATARALGADPPQPELLPDLSRHVGTLADLREPLVRALQRSSSEELLQRVGDLLEKLAESGDSPTVGLADRIVAQWRSAYLPGTDPGIESLRTDVERLEAELDTALDAWREGRRHREQIDERHQDAKRRAEHEGDALRRLDAQDREAELQEELGRAVAAVRDARDHVFRVVAPGTQTFDPRHDYGQGHPPLPTHPGDSDDRSAAGPPEDPAGTVDTAAAEAADATRPARGRVETDPSAATPVAAEPPDTERGSSWPEPRSAVDRRQASAPEGLWRTLADGRPGIAYHIARLCAEHGFTVVPPTLADVIAASMLAPHVHSPDSESVRDLRPILERIDPAALLRDERRQAERDAISLLLFSATMRPALFAPATGAPSLLRAVSLSGSLKPVYDLATRVADHADRLLGVRLHASLFRASRAGGWQEQFDALAGRLRTWQGSANSKQNIYGPATRVWRDLLVHGPLAKLIALISAPDRSARSDVETIHKEISDQRSFNQLVHRTYGKGRKRNPIEGRALRQIWNDVQPAVDLSGQWLSLMDTRPDTAGFVSQRIDALHRDLERDGRRAIETLQDAAATASSATPFAAAQARARNAVIELLQLFDLAAPIAESSLSANVIRSRDLLYVTEVDIDISLTPTSTDPSRLLERLANTAAHAETMRGAFDARLKRDDLTGARLALDFLETDEDGEGSIAAFAKSIRARRTILRTELRSTQRHLERAFCRGQLPADDRNEMSAGITVLRQATEPSSSMPPRLDEVEVLTGSSLRLREIDDRIEATSRMSVERVRGRLREVPADQMDEAARSIVEETIAQGYVQTAHEQINRLERGESVELPPPTEEVFSEFTRAAETIEAARESIDIQTILRCAERRESVAGVQFDKLSEEEAQSAWSLLDAWYQAARRRSADKTRLRDLLRSLGFSVRTVNPQRSGSHATVVMEPIADRTVCPSRQFGSEANGRYRVFLNADRSAIDSIFRSIGIEGGEPAIVLHFGCLGADRNEIRKRATREHRLFLVIDESLVLFLAGRASNRLSALFRCTLPYSAAHPYATTSGLVPRELFYGRRSERSTIMDPFGACFIYGGRQLGKTALLRQVEQDYTGPDRVAKWIDLKVNEIDRAPDLWSVLQRALRPSHVVRRDREIDPENRKQVESLLREIREWLDARPTRRLLLLLDEADHFLEVDSENDFQESARLKGLMDETNRRFKVVFAGLHNVLRTTRHANHPLAHLGDPICVGAMTSNGEWKEAQALVREPLQAVGCRFGRDDLSTRILAHTNYYPSLIQLYGAELMRRLRDSDRAFPYDIGDDDIDDAYSSGELRSAIRERFLLTLQLDQRYEVIAYALAYELKEGADLDRGLERDRIFEATRFWWPEGFDLRDVKFDMLLQEMEGLGVLRAIQPGWYTLRNPNILLLLGSRDDIEKALTQEREPEPETQYAPESFRARYPREPSSPRRGPLTRQQESQLHSGGVGVICGCAAAGLDDVAEFLSQRIGSDEFAPVRPAASAGDFERQLRKLRAERNSVTVRLVPPTVNWDATWIRTAKHVLQEKARGRRLWNRVAFIAKPEHVWRLMTEAAESDLEGVDWFSLGPCDLTFLRRWLVDINATANAGEARDFLRISGGWPVELDRFGRKRSSRTWQARIDELQREVVKNAAKRLRDGFGLTDQAEAVFRGLADADDPFDDESIELVSSDIGEDPRLMRRRVDWGERLGLLSVVGGGAWRFNPLVRRLLEAVSGR